MFGKIQSRALHVLRTVAGQVATATIVIFLLARCLFMTFSELSDVFSLQDIGYGDSYILYDILHFQKSGVIYRDLSLPPYLPAQYSPVVYMLYSIPGRIANSGNPFLGPRLIALTAFLLCVLAIMSIARSLIPARSTWLWAALLACSIGAMRIWVLQLRGDFLGILFDLLAIRLLLGESGWMPILAGVCAGLATQFKFTYVAALVAGSLWLVVRRTWRNFGGFAAAGILSSVGVYLFFWIWEHRMFQQMMALSPGISDLPGLFRVIYHVLNEPVILLAALAISPAALRSGSRWGLLIVFALTSFSIATLTDIQAGGNVNYFYEVLFAIVPAAVLGVRRLTAWAGERVGVGLFVTMLFGFYLLPPTAKDLSDRVRLGVGPAAAQPENRQFQKIQHTLLGQHIFSTVPRLALLDAEPALMEPYLLSYSQRLGKFDPTPIFQRIRVGEFDVVITQAKSESWRGIAHIGPDLRHAIMASYRPQCVYEEYLFHLPVSRLANSSLEHALNEIGCMPVACDRPSLCPVW